MRDLIYDIIQKFRKFRNDQVQKSTRYVISVASNDGRKPARLVTKSLDHFRNTIKKIDDRDIYYIAKRTGRRMKNIKAIAIYNAKLDEVVCKKELAFIRLMGTKL